MRRFRNILVVPVTRRTEAPPGLREAVALADASGAYLRLLGHIDDGQNLLDSRSWQPGGPDLRRALIDAQTRRLNTWATEVGRPDLEIAVSIGSLSRQVTAAVDDAGHDLVVIAADGLPEAAAAARQIVDACHCPVWLLRPGFSGANVLAAVDPSRGRDHNRLILELARSQAELHGGHLRVMNAWELPGRALLEQSDSMLVSDEQVAALATALGERTREWLDDLVHEVGLPEHAGVHVVDGLPARAIHGLSMLYRCDLVVIGAGRPPAEDRGIGSTVDQVLAEPGFSVLAISPPV